MITSPTVGRKVWYRPSVQDLQGSSDSLKMEVSGVQPLDATIVCVHSDRLVNLIIFDVYGTQHTRRSVTLVQDGDDVAEGGRYCEWMPYQLKQAVKHAVEDGAKSSTI